MLEEIKKKLGDGVEVKEISVPKNNGVVLNGYCITKKGENIGATIYVDEVPEDEVVDYVVRKYNSIEIPKLDMNVGEKSYILSNVYPMLVNREANEDRLKTMVHRSFVDLEIIYRVNVNNTGSYAVENKVLELADISEEELHDAAMKNLGDLCITYNLRDKLGIPPSEGDIPMIIVTYKDHNHGAGAILNTDLLEKLKVELESDLFVIPSSVDEVIVVPAALKDKEELNHMIKVINRSEVEEVNVLSDHVYVYKDGKVEVA